MDVSTFYALFSATCFTLLGLWWGVVQKHEDWMRDLRLRDTVGGIYLSFLLPALMGLFAQVGVQTSAIWRTGFVVIALVGAVSVHRLLAAQRGRGRTPGPLMRHPWVVTVLYGLVAFFGLVPEAGLLYWLTPLQVEALLLIALVLVAHGLVWEFMIDAAESSSDPDR